MIRAARADDYAAFARLFTDLGVDDPVPTEERWRTTLAAETLVADRGGVIGYVSFYPLGDTSHVRNLVVAADARNTGVGAALMHAAAAALRGHGAGDWHLNVKDDNAAALALYARLGLRVAHRTAAIRVRWDDAAQLPAEPATSAPATLDDAPAIERALALVNGRITNALRTPGRVVVQLRDAGDAPVGVAAFDPAHPGAYPFAVARVTLAGTLLAALAPHRAHDHLQVVVERDEALRELLLASGGELRTSLLHLTGPLPR